MGKFEGCVYGNIEKKRNVDDNIKYDSDVYGSLYLSNSIATEILIFKQ